MPLPVTRVRCGRSTCYYSDLFANEKYQFEELLRRVALVTGSKNTYFWEYISAGVNSRFLGSDAFRCDKMINAITYVAAAYLCN